MCSSTTTISRSTATFTDISSALFEQAGKEFERHDEKLIFIGGSSPKTSAILDRIPDVLAPLGREFNTCPSIREIIDFDYQPGSTFVVLSELDEHTFAGLDEEQLDAFQTIFNGAIHVLWVTEDAWCTHLAASHDDWSSSYPP